MNALILEVLANVLRGWLIKSQIIGINFSQNRLNLIFKKARKLRTVIFCLNPQTIFIQKYIPKITEKDGFYQYAKKNLAGSAILNITTALPDRVLIIQIKKTVGAKIFRYKMIFEFLGRNPNIIIADEENKVLYALKITPQRVNSARAIRAGKNWPQPIKQYKLPIWQVSDLPENIGVDKIMKYYCGIEKKTASLILENGTSTFIELKKQFLNKNFQPRIVYYKNKEILFPFRINIKQKSRIFDDFMSLFEYLRSKEDNKIVAQKKEYLNKIIAKELEKLNKKLSNTYKELEKTKDWKKYEEYAVFIKSNLWRLDKNRRGSILPDNPYSKEIEISPKLTILENMSYLFKKSKKLKRTIAIKKEIIGKIENDLKTLKQIEYDLIRSAGEDELSSIEEELSEIGLIKKKRTQKRKKSSSEGNIIKKKLSDEVIIYIGKNAKGNEKITFGIAGKNDLWFHAKEVPGSHILIKGKYSEKELKYAAYLAAINSKSSKNRKVDVDYTLKKFIKKPKGAKLGMVIYNNYKTTTVRTDEIWNY